MMKSLHFFIVYYSNKGNYHRVKMDAAKILFRLKDQHFFLSSFGNLDVIGERKDKN